MNVPMYKVYLKPKKEESLKRFHPWVFSGAIAHFDGEPEEGEVVEIYTSKKEFIAKGHFSDWQYRRTHTDLPPGRGNQRRLLETQTQHSIRHAPQHWHSRKPDKQHLSPGAWRGR